MAYIKKPGICAPLRQAGLVALSISVTLVLSACGGGGSEANPDRAQPITQAALTGLPQGYISVEERSGKRVFDGWFSQGSSEELSALELWSEGAQRCSVVADQPVATGAVVQVGSRWRNTLFAGDTIRVQSRSGDVVNLHAQRYDDAVVYATAERWLSQALPDDSQLVITGSDQFPAFGPVALTPLTPLVASAPVGGYSTDVKQPVVWEPSGDISDSIQLQVLATSSDAGKATDPVTCWLNDNGQFVLPDAVVQNLPENPQLVYSLVRIREQTHESEGAKLHISQISYP